MADKPRECPFCGGVSVAHIGLHVFVDALVRCEVCGAESGLFEEFDTAELNKAAAVAAWNRRFLPEGSVVVPREPTEAMEAAGGNAKISRPLDEISLSEALDSEGSIEVLQGMEARDRHAREFAAAVYRAMIAAATEDAP